MVWMKNNRIFVQHCDNECRYVLVFHNCTEKGILSVVLYICSTYLCCLICYLDVHLPHMLRICYGRPSANRAVKPKADREGRLCDDAGKKREAYMIEMQKLREGRSAVEQDAVQGRLTISDIKLPLKSEFMSKIGTVHGELTSRYCCRQVIVLEFSNVI